LAFTLAGRYDHASDFGGKTTWQSGLMWRPTATILLRGGYGLSYKAPQLVEIGAGTFFSQPLTIDSGVVDPFRGGQGVAAPYNFASNPNLKPETGDSRTLGIVYSSAEVRGLEASLTYLDINISNYIGQHNVQELVNNPSLFPGAVIRGAATPQDQQQGYLGPITQINDSYYNYGDLHVAGFDGDVKFPVDTTLGRFTPWLAIANIYKWQSALTPQVPLTSQVSRATFSGVGFAPRWKGTVALSWKQGPLSGDLAGRYLGRYKDYQDFGPNSSVLGNTWIIDLSAHYETGQALASANRWLAGTYVTLGAINLFDKAPPFSYGVTPYDHKEYSIIGRVLYVNAGIKW
jgi:iron complex outermembrane recepter protein